jgi:hypothetical protein
MGIRDVVWNIIKWKFIKKRLGYNCMHSDIASAALHVRR